MVHFCSLVLGILSVFGLCCCAPSPQEDKTPVLSGLLDVATAVLQIADSLLTATNATAPLVLGGLKEMADTAPLVFGFAKAFAEVQQEKNQEVFDTFFSSFRCELSCKNEKDSEKKSACEQKFCKNSDGPEPQEDLGNVSNTDV
eukprot:GFUD01018709.1.p1 GENE.GFUD01018709.1~~GFUD01018709.1.p1  ORF type:complete len:163 (+),score=22.81 GFUD01018709.1:60-491(+)